MSIMIGSARHDENGKYVGGKAGDQLQKSSANDTTGEVSMQTFYVHSLGWNVFRPKNTSHAGIIASKMISACNNKHIGYDQGNRLGIISYGIDTKTDTEGDCSSIVRECIKEATGTDPGNFDTSGEAAKLKATGLFEEAFAFVSQEKTPVYNGDVLVTKKKGHTAIVVSGNPRVVDKKDTTTTASQTTTASASETKVDGAKSFDKSLAGTYTTTKNLNIRNGAGTSKKVITTLAKGTNVRNYGYYTDVDGVRWLYVAIGKQTGYCSIKCLNKQS